MTEFVLTSVRVENLACFSALELRPAMSTLLLGRNGTGKSTLMDLLFTLGAVLSEGHGVEDALPDYQLAQGTGALIITLASGSRTLSYRLQLQPAEGVVDVSLGPVGPDWLIQEETVTDGDGQPVTHFQDGQFTSADLPKPLGLVRDRSPLATLTFPEDSLVFGLKRWAGDIWMLRLEPRRMMGSAPEPDDALAVSGENFAAWLLNFRNQKRTFHRIIQSLNGAIDGLERLRFVRSGREWVLVARFAGDHDVDFDRLSDGQRCLIVLHAVLVLAKGLCSLLLLDEPDAHVTPEEILPLFMALRERSQHAGFQVIVASHHPHVIDLMAPESAWELRALPSGVVAEPFRVPRAEGLAASRYLLMRARG
ncbi:MAG: AAA family ATPase [Alphaproteobacteria bacterium]|nr:AAA family ATPase [Alphaproteobacteria bacterium]